jgi:hypothetical protein
MFIEKQELIAMHERELEAWDRLLTSLSTAQITNRLLPDGLSIKDTIAHLGAWQERTIAQLEAALHGQTPRFPHWPVELGEEESPDAVDRANAWILETHRDRLWADVHQGWRKNFLHFLELLRAIPESDVRPGGKLAWVAEYQPLDGHTDTYDYHHAEHRVRLEAWIRTHTSS